MKEAGFLKHSKCDLGFVSCPPIVRTGNCQVTYSPKDTFRHIFRKTRLDIAMSLILYVSNITYVNRNSITSFFWAPQLGDPSLGVSLNFALLLDKLQQKQDDLDSDTEV